MLISIENEKNIKKNVHIILNIHNIPNELCDYIASFVYITSNELKVCCKLLDNDYYDLNDGQYTTYNGYDNTYIVI